MAQLSYLANEINNIKSAPPVVTKDGEEVVRANADGRHPFSLHDSLTVEQKQHLTTDDLSLHSQFDKSSDHKRNASQTAGNPNELQKRYQIQMELEKVNNLKKKFNRSHQKLACWDRILKISMKLASLLATIALLIGLEQRSGGNRTNDGVYYLAVSSTMVAFLISQISETLNLQERAHINKTTFRGLQSLYDYILYQVAKDQPTASQLDHILTDMNTRLMLIRDSAEGVLFEASLAK